MNNSIFFKILAFALLIVVTMPCAIRAMIEEVPVREDQNPLTIMESRSAIINLINSWQNTFPIRGLDSESILAYETRLSEESEKLKVLLPDIEININIENMSPNKLMNETTELALYRMFLSGKLLSDHLGMLITLNIIQENEFTYNFLCTAIRIYNENVQNNPGNIVHAQNNELHRDEAILQNSTDPSKIKYLAAAFFGSLGFAATMIYRKNLATIVASYLSLLTIFTIPAADMSAITHELLKK